MWQVTIVDGPATTGTLLKSKGSIRVECATVGDSAAATYVSVQGTCMQEACCHKWHLLSILVVVHINIWYSPGYLYWDGHWNVME